MSAVRFQFQGVRLMLGLRKFSLGAVALAILAFSGPSSAQLYDKKAVKSETVAMPTPAEVQSLGAQPKTVALKGLDDSAQLVVTAQLANRIQDLSGDVK